MTDAERDAKKAPAPGEDPEALALVLKACRMLDERLGIEVMTGEGFQDVIRAALCVAWDEGHHAAATGRRPRLNPYEAEGRTDGH